jgi:hypothetical protein
MDVFFYFVCGIIGIFLLAIVAFPEFLVPEYKAKKTKMNASHWGTYEGLEPVDPETQLTIEVQANLRKHKVTAGSSMYASGRGVKQG